MSKKLLLSILCVFVCFGITGAVFLAILHGSVFGGTDYEKTMLELSYRKDSASRQEIFNLNILLGMYLNWLMWSALLSVAVGKIALAISARNKAKKPGRSPGKGGKPGSAGTRYRGDSEKVKHRSPFFEKLPG